MNKCPNFRLRNQIQVSLIWSCIGFLQCKSASPVSWYSATSSNIACMSGLVLTAPAPLAAEVRPRDPVVGWPGLVLDGLS